MTTTTSSTVIIGTVAFDTIQTPVAQGEKLLGGSATYASLAAAQSGEPVSLVSIIGDDFPESHRTVLQGIDCTGLHTEPGGKTFHWSGYYEGNMAQAITRQTDLNVLTQFKPCIPEQYRQHPILFCANFDPDLQYDAIKQCDKPTYSIIDTMNFWIETKPNALRAVLKLVDMIVLNDQEILSLTQAPTILTGIKTLLTYGPTAVIVKKGEHGAIYHDQTNHFSIPAYPVDTVVDPTGAGDTFAGGLVGYLSKTKDFSITGMKRAMIHGTLLAAKTVQALGTHGIQTLTTESLKADYDAYYQYAALPVY